MRVAKHRTRGKETENFYLFFTDHLGRRERKLPLPASLDKRLAESFGNKVEALIGCRIAGTQPSPALIRWLGEIPGSTRERLVTMGLVDASLGGSGKDIAIHIADFQRFMEQRERTNAHTKLTIQRIKSVVEGCGFNVWSDVSAVRVSDYLALRRSEGLSKKSSNYYFRAMWSFCHWMVLNGRATGNPLEVLAPLPIAKSDEVHSRVNLSLDEATRLLAAVSTGPEAYGMDGQERALLYQFAIETGLRANAIRSLTVGSIDFQRGSVTLEDKASKNREQVVVPLRPAMLAKLKEFTANKLPNVKLFGGYYKALTDKTSNMIQADYALTAVKDDTGKVIVPPIPYQDASGRYRDFHALRHTGYTWMEAQGVPRQIIARIFGQKTVSMGDVYSHGDWGQMQKAVNMLPDVSPEVKTRSA